MIESKLRLSSKLTLRVFPGVVGASLGWKIQNALRWDYIWGLITTKIAVAFSGLTGIPTMVSKLRIVKTPKDGPMVDYGWVNRRVITTDFVNYMAGQLVTEAAAWGDFKFHDLGTGVGAAVVGDTALGTPIAITAGRTSGTQGSTANGYETVATYSCTGTIAVTEHGLFNSATDAAEIMMDRHVFSAVNVVDGDSLQTTYVLTISSGG